MAHNFGSLVFTPVVKALQEKYGNRRQYARLEAGGASPDRMGPDEIAFIAERDSFLFWQRLVLTVGRMSSTVAGRKAFSKLLTTRRLLSRIFAGISNLSAPAI